jgi:surface polysaccharide O-acyltransferase-like enzyme
MRAAAILGVLVIHSATRYDVAEPLASIAEYCSHLSRPCIGIFLFLSGYFLSNRAWGLSELFVRLKRVWIPYTLFSMAAFLYQDSARLMSGDLETFGRLFVRYFLGHSFAIYYFVFVISATYLLHSVVQRFQVSHRLMVIVFASVTFLHNVSYHRVASTFPNSNTADYFRNIYELRYIFGPFFFYLGCVARTSAWFRYLKGCKNQCTAVWILCGATYVCAIGFDLHADGYDSLFGTAYTIATIGLFSANDFRLKFSRYLSDQSYFIYLSHIFVVYALRDFGWLLGFGPLAFLACSLVLSLLLPLLFLETSRLLSGRPVVRALGGI